MGHWEIQNYGSINGHNVNEWINSMNLKTWKETVLCYRKCDVVAKNGCFQHVRYFNKGLRDICGCQGHCGKHVFKKNWYLLNHFLLYIMLLTFILTLLY